MNGAPDATVGAQVPTDAPAVAQAEVIRLLRAARDLSPTVPAIRCYCGNLGGPHNRSGCGEPAQMWSKQAWEIEFLARRIEGAGQDLSGAA